MSLTLTSLANRFWNTYSEYSPTVATVRGEHAYDDQLRRFDGEWLDAIASRFRAIANEASEVDTTALPTQDRISFGLLAHESDVWATKIEQRFLVAAIDPYIGPHMALLSDTRQNTVSALAQANALLDRYRTIPEYLASAILFHREQADKGMTPAMASLTRVIDQLDRYLASDLESDAFLVLTHRNLPAEDIPEHRMGWVYHLPRLAAVATGQDPGPDVGPGE